MWSLAGSLTDRVLADSILIPPRPPILRDQYKDGKGSSKKYGNSNIKKIYYYEVNRILIGQ